MILRNLLRRRTRTLLTLLSIAVGVAAVVALGAMAEGLVNNYTGLVSGSEADLLVLQADAMDVAFSAVDETVAERIAKLPDVVEVDGVVYGWLTAAELDFFIIFGHEPRSRAIEHFRLVEGTSLTGGRQMLLGKAAAKALDKSVGDMMRIYGAPYEVVGIFETGEAMEEGAGVISLEEAQEQFGKQRQVSMFQVYLRNVDQAEAVQDRIEKLFPKLTASRAKDYGLQVEWLGYVKAMAWGVALIAVVLGGLAMMNTMIMTVFERTREIGTLRALGWRRGRVLRMILGEAVALSTLGAALGMAIGVGLTRLVARSPGIGAMVAGQFTPQLFGQALLTALVLGTIGGIYPAWWGANLQPVEALRHEGGAGGGGSGSGGERALPLPLELAALRELWRRRLRTGLTMTGIAVGVASIVALNGLAAGFIQQFNQLSSAGGGDLTLRQADIADTSLSAIDERIGRAIAGMSQVEDVSGMVLGFAMTEDLPFFLAYGLDPVGRGMAQFPLMAGRYVQRPNEMMLGRAAARIFGKEVGDSFQFYDNRYRIVGVYESEVSIEDGGGVIALQEAQRVFGKPRQVSFYQIKVRDPADVEFVRTAIEQRFPEVLVSLSNEFAQNTNDMAQMEEFVGGLAFIALFVGSIVVMNTMVMNVYERTREIGTLRALGWRRSRILGMMLQESLLLCLLSGLLGILLGMGMNLLAGRAPMIGSFLAPVYEARAFVQAVVMALLLGIIGGLYPAWRASRLSPAEALRYE